MLRPHKDNGKLVRQESLDPPTEKRGGHGWVYIPELSMESLTEYLLGTHLGDSWVKILVTGSEWG